ncbi:hypothetical protein SAMN04488589_0971 [Methanolobus vulcani]|uniref:Uncharacterized protein n=1 Tax=Methanolobus vulcani TaxID=38026 RepID=A0A7Z7AVL2_9EURY|nr:hypothetical protein [Methanolobus vulcani]SDF63568.1 hypothetical protein SAMN04488589_0971 [Methanolobus vulcani]
MSLKFRTSILLIAMLLVCAFIVQPVSSQEVLTASETPSDFEQGLIDALNSKSNILTTDTIITDYFEKNQVSTDYIKKDSTSSKTISLRTYELNDGSYISFPNDNFFFISDIKETENTSIVTKSTSRTSDILASRAVYSKYGGQKVYTLYTQGYFTYDGETVDAHLLNSWYKKEFLAAAIWKVSNWEKGTYEYSSGTTSKFYGRGNFEWGLYISGYGLTLGDYYNELYVVGDEDGDYIIAFDSY